ncbi:MAG: hypothetical protein JWN27_4081 [Candidatus Eremiobacteraeota bacterium]|nr:hypothetical protein [Candidatus Eremiobacteraeota bacterium]
MASSPAAFAAQPPPFSDQLCPEATSKVIAVQSLTTGADPQQIYTVARAAADAYDVCAKLRLGAQDIEPGTHYATTREAQFGVLAARALIAMKRYDDARRELLRDRTMAADVVGWSASTHGVDPGVTIQTNNRSSRYQAVAQLVVDAATAELKNLPATAPSPAPSSTP